MTKGPLCHPKMHYNPSNPKASMGKTGLRLTDLWQFTPNQPGFSSPWFECRGGQVGGVTPSPLQEVGSHNCHKKSQCSAKGSALPAQKLSSVPIPYLHSGSLAIPTGGINFPR